MEKKNDDKTDRELYRMLRRGKELTEKQKDRLLKSGYYERYIRNKIKRGKNLTDEEKEVLERKDKIRAIRKRRPVSATKAAICLFTVFILIITVIEFANTLKKVAPSTTLAEFQTMVDDGYIDSIQIIGSNNVIEATAVDGTVYEIYNPGNDTFIYDLEMAGVSINYQQSTFMNAFINFMSLIPTYALLIFLLYYIATLVQGNTQKVFDMVDSMYNTVRFKDVAGMTEIKDEIKDVVDRLDDYDELAEAGARPYKGIMLYGPPGVGKTLIARAIAGESGLPFISASGSDFVEVFVGTGAARVRRLWDMALQHAPCILFIDEIDALGKRRGSFMNTNSEMSQTLNALLQRMDGLNEGQGILVIGATNNLENIDEALLRPGRFDRTIYIGPPRLRSDRDEIVSLYLKTKKLDDEVTLEKASDLMVGLTGAEIEDVLNLAVYNSFREGRNGVLKLIDIDRGVTGLHTKGVPVAKSDSKDVEVVAYHEAGHCLVNLLNGGEVLKVTVIPYSSGVGGMTVSDITKDEDRKLKLTSELENDIKVLLGGIAAEEVIFNDHSQGASNDLERASELVLNMMNGIGYGKENSDVNLFNRNVLSKKGIQVNYSDIIKDGNDILNRFFEEDKAILRENKDLLERLAKRLIEEDTVLYPTLENI